MAARKAPETINRIGGIQLYQLMQYTQANYTQAGLLDAEFAKKASDELGFPVTKGNVQGAREAFGIEATFLARRREAVEPRTRLERIEARLERLEAWMKRVDPNGEL